MSSHISQTLAFGGVSHERRLISLEVNFRKITDIAEVLMWSIGAEGEWMRGRKSVLIREIMDGRNGIVCPHATMKDMAEWKYGICDCLLLVVTSPSELGPVW